MLFFAAVWRNSEDLIWALRLASALRRASTGAALRRFFDFELIVGVKLGSLI